MALTIDSSPSAANHFAYRPVVWKVSSNDANIIRCIADVYINGTYKISLEKSPDIGTSNIFTFDVQNVLQDNLTAHVPNFSYNGGKLYSGTQGLYYNVRFFEVLDNGTTFDTSWAEDGAGTSYIDSTSVYNPAYAFNGTLRHEETQDLDDFKIANGVYAGLHRINKITTTFLGSQVNKARKLKRGDFAVLSMWQATDSAIQGRVLWYDENNINTFNGTSSTLASSTHLWHYILDTSILYASTKKMLMRVESTTPSAITNYVLYDIVEDCNDYLSLYWQNDFGGIDYYLFRSAQIKTYESKSETFTKPLTSNFSVSDFSETILNKNSKIGITAISEVLDRTEADGLSNLITHGNRAWIYVNSQLIPVLVADGKIETLNTLDGEYRLKIDLIHSNKLNVQRY